MEWNNGKDGNCRNSHARLYRESGSYPDTHFMRTENTWADAEFYFYGVLTDAGGKNSINIHLDTKEFGNLTLETPKEVLVTIEKNILYKAFGVRAAGKQNLETGEIDRQSLHFIEFVDYSSRFDDHYLSGLIQKAKNTWAGVDTDEWLANIRGDYAF